MTSGPETRSEPLDLWRLDSPEARALSCDAERLDDLQTVLRCCERLLVELAMPQIGDVGRGAVVEALWLLALTSYARSFSTPTDGTGLTEKDVVDAVSEQEGAKDWHQALLRLHGLYSSTAENPREQFATSLARDDAGTVVAIALTSATLPDVDETTVRAAGGIALALGTLTEERMGLAQEALMMSSSALSRGELDALERWQAEGPGQGPSGPGPIDQDPIDQDPIGQDPIGRGPTG